MSQSVGFLYTFRESVGKVYSRFLSVLHPSVASTNPRMKPHQELIARICRNERISPYRLSIALGVHNVVVSSWTRGAKTPSKPAMILLKLVDKHGLKFLFGGESTQPIDNQDNASRKIT